MALIPDQVEYTDKDFDSVLARLQNVAQSVFPEWTDFNTGSFGNILLELFAFVGDVLTFYQDAQARETRIVTARRRKNLLALGKLIGFTPRGNTPAQADETFTLAAVPVNDVIIPEGTIVRTAEVTDAVQFRLLEDLTISAGSNPPVAIAVVENSDEVADTFASTSLPNQEFVLTRGPFIDTLPAASTGVTDDVGTWAQVTSFLNSTSADLHYTITVDENDRATIRFGNGTNGAIPTGTITVSYTIGGGTRGNVDAGRINRIVGSFTDVLGNPVTVAVTNVDASSGGANRESNESIRQRAPETLRVQNRAVAREDFEIVARQVDGVSRALMLTSNEDPAIPENAGTLFVIAAGGGPPSEGLKDEVLAQFEGVDAPYPMTLTFALTVADPIFLDVTIRSTVFFSNSSTAFKALAAAQVRANLTAFFASELADGSLNTAIDFGFGYKDAEGAPANEIPKSDIANVIRDTAGIRKLGDLQSDLLINGQPRDLTIDVKEFPRLVSIVLIDGDTGESV